MLGKVRVTLFVIAALVYTVGNGDDAEPIGMGGTETEVGPAPNKVFEGSITNEFTAVIPEPELILLSPG